MRTATQFGAIFVVAAFARCSQAQSCERYWASLPVSELPGYPSVSYFPLTMPEGPTLFAKNYLTGNDRLFTWRGSQWIEVSRKGLPPPVGIGRINALNDGTGIHLYAQIYPGNVTWNPPIRGFRFDGEAWTPMPEDFWPSQFHAPYLSADLGDGMRIYGRRPPDICVWNETEWQPLPLPAQTQGSIHLEVEDDGAGMALYMFGGLWPLHQQTAYGFAKWDGTDYSIPFTGPGTVNEYGFYPATCAVTFDDGSGPAMYSIRGPRTDPSNLNYPALWRWRNNTWSIVGRPIASPNTYTGVSHICIFDDGRGPAIYVMGTFDNVDGIACNNIARWDGHSWEPLGHGLYGIGNAGSTYMGVINDASGSSLVLVGEGIYFAGGGSARRGAKWVGCPNCYANCDFSSGSPRLTANDFMCFINKYAAKDPYANCDVNDAINITDFLCFLNKYSAGCP